MTEDTTEDTTPDTTQGILQDTPSGPPSAPASGPAHCPKCGVEAPGAPECRRCGVLVDLYRGPALGAAALRPPASPAPPAEAVAGPPPFPREPVGEAFVRPPDPFQGTFEIGDILRQTFTVYFANFLPFCLLAAVSLAPLLLYQGLALLGISSPPLANRWIGILLTSLGSYLATAVLTYGVVEQLRGSAITVADCLRHGAAALLPVLGLVVVQAVAIWFAFLLCLIPGIVLSMQWAVAIPVAVTERTGIGLTLNRSTYLTDGLRWEIFGTWVVLFVLQFGLGLVLGLGLAAAPPPVRVLLRDIVEILAVGLSATNTAVIYYRLRSLKEGVDTEGVASVFG
jgi:hypothetical protein